MKTFVKGFSWFSIVLLVCSLALAGALAAPSFASTADTQQNRASLTTGNTEALSPQDSKVVSRGKVYTIRTATEWRNISRYNGGSFKLGRNITLPSESYYLTISENRTYTIDLNGYQVKTAYTGVPLRTVAPLYIKAGTVVLKNSKSKGLLYSTETAAVVVDGSAKFYLQNATIVNNATEFRSDITSGVMTYGSSAFYLQGKSRIQSIGNGIALFGTSRLEATGSPWVRAGANNYKGQFTHYGSGISVASKNARITLKGGSYGTKASQDVSLWSPAVTMTYAQSANYPILDQMGYAMDSALGYGCYVTDAKGTTLKPRGSNLSDYYDGVNHPSWTKLIGSMGLKEEQRYTTTVKDSAGYYAVYVKLKASVAKLRANSVPVYWLVHKKAGENLYTTDKNEVKKLSQGNWTNKGIVWYAPKKGQKVYRLYAKKINDHHYTSDINEVRKLTKGGTWKVDSGKAMWYSGGKVQTYRLFNPARNTVKKPGTHRFATSAAQVNTLKKAGWKQDGVKMYGATL